MDAFVRGCAHDIFVSYAHLDNEVPAGDGWVTTLMRALPLRVQPTLGHKVAMWTDRRLAGHVELTPTLFDAVKNSATLVLIMSPGYLASQWCADERNAFFDVVRDRQRAGSRVFVVHKLKTDLVRRPTALREYLGYPFWREDPLSGLPRTLEIDGTQTDREEYHKELDTLAYELAKELERLAIRRQSSGVAQGSGVTVFLAEATEDLQEEHEEVKRYLLQADLTVLPEQPYPDQVTPFLHAVQRDIDASAVFVQLVSRAVGRKPLGGDRSRIHLQCECAQAARKAILQWRLPGSLEQARDEQRDFLERPSVRTGALDEFKREILEHAIAAARRPESFPRGNRGASALVVVDAETGDEDVAERVSRLVINCDVHSFEAWQRGGPAQVTGAMLESLKECDALIIVYGKADGDWVDKQLLLWSKVAAMRDQPVELLAVYEDGPPQPKPELRVRLARTRIEKFRGGSDEERLKTFLNDLKRRRRTSYEAPPEGRVKP